MGTAMLRVEESTRDRVMEVARDHFGGISADEAVKRLLDEHWERRAIASMEQYRREDPEGWKQYLAEVDADSAADLPVADDWSAEAAE